MILRFVLFLAHLLAELPRYPQGPFSGTPDTGGGPANSVTGPDNYGDPPKVGTSGRFARGDHDHGLPAAGALAFAVPNIALGTAAAAGVAGTTIRSDSTVVAFDATAPVTQAFADVAAAGAAAVAARRDHKHGMPASPVATATQAQGSGGQVIASANTYVDAPGISLALTAGTYIIFAYVSILAAAAQNARVTAKLWDGTTAISSGEVLMASTATIPGWAAIPLMGLVTLGGAATYKVSVASDIGGNNVVIENAAAQNGAGDNASGIIALKIA